MKVAIIRGTNLTSIVSRPVLKQHSNSAKPRHKYVSNRHAHQSAKPHKLSHTYSFLMHQAIQQWYILFQSVIHQQT